MTQRQLIVSRKDEVVHLGPEWGTGEQVEVLGVQALGMVRPKDLLRHKRQRVSGRSFQNQLIHETHVEVEK